MTTSFSGTSGVTFPDNSTQNTAATGFGFKNRILNGSMMIDQRNAGASSTGGWATDRWLYQYGAGTLTSQQSTSIVPSGFAYSVGLTVTSAGTRNAGDYYIFQQKIEGLNVSDLGFGAAGAATVTISFWVRSSVTGTYTGVLQSGDNTRCYPFTYTISASNTWQQVTVTIAGDTSGGTTAYPINNGIGLYLKLDLGCGTNYEVSSTGWQASTNKVGMTSQVGWAQTAGATFYITGVQLEKGSTATSFDYRPYGTELQLCQRYFENGTVNNSVIGSYYSSAGTGYATGSSICFKSTKRATPTIATGTITFSALSSITAVSVFNPNATVDSVAWTYNITGPANACNYVTHTYTATSEL